MKSYEYTLDHTEFNTTNKIEADNAVNKLTEYLHKACETSIPKLKHNRNRQLDQNDKIDELRNQKKKTCIEEFRD